MDEGGIQGWVGLTPLDATWRLGTIGDFNDDGFADIYWLRNGPSGATIGGTPCEHMRRPCLTKSSVQRAIAARE